jgi:hypothetical protein
MKTFLSIFKGVVLSISMIFIVLSTAFYLTELVASEMPSFLKTIMFGGGTVNCFVIGKVLWDLFD